MEKELWKGNEAIAEAAIRAGCDCFFGYPITPQSEVPEYMSAHLPKAGGVFLGCEVVSVRHTGESIPRGTVRLTELPAGVKKLETTGAGAVVSELRNGDNRFVVIVNRDFKNPMTLQIELDETASRILKDGSVVPASLYHETMVVEPGDAMIYMLE